MRLHVEEWGDPGAPTVVCLHGVTGFGGRFTQLAEERWASRFHVLAPDLRGHGRSGWEPPWSLATYVEDLVETFPEPAFWVGHSFGGRLLIELAARHPERIRRAVLLDPAIQILPNVAGAMANYERADPVWDSVAEYVASRTDAGGMDIERATRDLALHVDTLPDGRVRRRTSQPAVVAIYGELASAPPPPDVLTMPTLLVHAPEYALVRDDQLVYGDETLALAGGHMVMWSEFDAVAAAVEQFLEDPRAEG